MKRAVALLCAAALASSGGAAEKKRPNVVILLADDWGYSDIGSFGSEIRTPNIDALAKAGVRFSDFHVAGSCSPTRAMLQTGIGNHRAGLGNMPETIPPEHVGKPGYDTVLNDRVVTMASLFRYSGYRTYLTGKWHLGKTADKLPTARGYDHAFSLADAGADNFEQRPIEGLYDTADWTEDGRPATLPKNYYSSRFVVDRMIDYIEGGRASGKPFFASVNFLANHIPVQAPDAYIARYRAAYDGGWTAIRTARRDRAAALGVIPVGTPMVTMASTQDWNALPAEKRAAYARAMAAYGGMAEAADEQVGRLIAHLKATGDYDNTIFVFLSDNGAEPTDPMATLLGRLNSWAHYDMTPAEQGRRGSFTSIGPGWASAAASPLRGYKFSAGEGGLRVPLIVAWPGNPALKAGRIAGRFAYVTDIAPTLLALADIPGHGGDYRGRPVEPMTGASLLPMLTGAADTVHPDTQPIGYELSGNAAIFRGDYKLVKNLPPTGTGEWHLYDIVRDPGETRDLAAAMPGLFRTMQADYAAYAARDRVLPMPAGYTAEQQITTNGFNNSVRPKLLRALPWVLALVLLPFGWGAWRRRRKAAPRRP
ncbi:MAG: arylsulfatase [Sphingomonas bacterium]|uniref:arylsulfatase n=1 Tax=Sphingomonas bacterium TaxID=1895847 RepID=UPI00262EEC20|nr:arylsulfatase [Sphingomonas bacterium]MDB5704527.1 arylsulfatase [Sphingomonas bacterium]